MSGVQNGARTVNVRFSVAGEPYVAILDDGHGMSSEELTAAMRHGSRNPVLRRDALDLGRFGLGLKTASLSQCRTLTVVSNLHCESLFLNRPKPLSVLLHLAFGHDDVVPFGVFRVHHAAGPGPATARYLKSWYVFEYAANLIRAVRDGGKSYS